MMRKCINPKSFIKRISKVSICVFLFVVVYCPVSGQIRPEKPLLEKEYYALWHTLRFPQISGDGVWTAYQVDYEKKQDTLFLIKVEDSIKYPFPNAHSGQFDPKSNPNLFVFKSNNNGIGIFNLETGKTEWIKKADRFEFSKNGRYLACYNPQNRKGYLRLLDIENNKVVIINGVESFSFDPLGNAALIITHDEIESKVELLQLKTMKRRVILVSEMAEFSNPAWNSFGNALAFIKNRNNSKPQLYYYKNIANPTLKVMDGADNNELNGLEISNLDLYLSNDGERVFFWTHQMDNATNHVETDTVKVQVWKGTDKWIYPRQKLDWEFNKTDRRAVWWPKSNKIFQIGNSERPEVILTGDQKFAVSYNLLTHEPQYRQRPQTDFFITNLKTRDTVLLHRMLETSNGYLNIDPKGHFLSYFENNNWWIYDIYKNTHTNITKNIDVFFNPNKSNLASGYRPYGCAGWTDGNDILIYDEFDIWRISCDGKEKKRLTKGREHSISYRLYNDLTSAISPRQNSFLYDLSNDNILTTRDQDYNEGYSHMKGDGEIIPLFSNPGKISHLRKAEFSKSFIFLKEDYNKPPSLFFSNEYGTKMLIQSNTQQDEFALGETELISYQNKQNEKLQGLLHYPDDYELGKQYPMVVQIYQEQAHQFHNYTNPGYNSDGYNYRDFTAAGYFVLEPDIVLQVGNPGISATDCVVAAVNKVLSKGIVNKSAIGLMGHSFGGYETAFIISQTDIFSAAVVGAGIFDIVGYYHTIEKNYGKPEMWRFEKEQWNFGSSFYDDRESYYNNSSLHNAKNIKTPTMIWTGNMDYHVNWHQSEQMFLALRRLGIDVKLLVYENEAHALLQHKNQKDLTNRIDNWFQKYLKDKSIKNEL